MSQLLETLRSYVPVCVTEQLAQQPHREIGMTGKQFAAAVLLADISGFTALTERLAQYGPSGAEELTRLLNSYFEQLIDLIMAHGGDIVKFAGDAVIAEWPLDARKDTPTLQQAVQRAAQCSLAIQAHLHDYQVADDTILSLKLAIGAGDILLARVGGVDNRWQFLVAGEPLVQIGVAESVAERGDIILSPQAWQLVQAQCHGEPLDNGCLRLLSADSHLPPRPLTYPALSDAAEPALWTFIPHSIQAKLSAGQSSWLAELRQVTVIFLNLPDLIDNLSLERSHDIMQALQTTIFRYEGTINKLTVDDKGVSLLAAFGLPPLTHEDDAHRGVRVALAMGNTLQRLGLQGAIGITSGRAFCGSVGSHLRREYTMMGDVVNMAARLMQAAGQQATELSPILCDERTYQATNNELTFETLPAIRVKGKSHPIAVYSPSASETVSPLSPIMQSSNNRLIGRQAERAALEEHLQQLEAGQHGVVIIQGEAGIGKSRLVSELLSQARLRELTSVVAAGDAIEKSTAYFAWQAIFRQIFGLIDTSDCQAMQGTVKTRLMALDNDLAQWLPLLNAVLPIEFADNEQTQNLDGKARANQTEMLLTELLTNRYGSRPLLLIIEDAHWLDSASWSLLQRVRQQLPSLLLVIATRPMEEALIPTEYKQLLLERQTHRLELTPLSPAETLTLVEHRLGVSQLPEPIADLIRDKAEGHPFFSEELAYALRDNGLIQIENGRCRIDPQIGDLQTLDFPNTIQGVITSRIDRLSAQQQLALKVASVIGRVFPLQTLAAIHPIEADKPHLPNYLATLNRLDITPLETPEPELAYIFKHIITQEVAYNLMPYAQRRQLHQAVAEWYEATYPELSPYYPLLAHHWRRVVEGQHVERPLILKTIDYSEKAGDQAAHIYANAEAITHYSKAIELAKTVDLSSQQRLNLYSRRGRALELSSRYDEALQNYIDWETTARQQGDRSLQLAALMAQATLHSTPTPLYNPETAEALSLQALNLAHELGDQQAESKALWDLMLLNIFGGEAEKSITFGEQSLTIARQLALTEQIAFTTNDLHRAYLNLGQLDVAERYLDEAISLWRQLGNQPMLSDSLSNLALLNYLQAKLDQTVALATESAALAASIDNLWAEAYASLLLGRAQFEQGQPESAIVAMKKAVSNAGQGEMWLGYCLSLSDLAVVYAYLGDLPQAMALAEQSIEHVEEIPVSFRAWPLSILAYIQLNCGQVEEAIQTAARGQAYVEQETIGYFALGWTPRLSIELQLTQGHYQQAIDLADQMANRFRQEGAHIYLSTMLYLKARGLLALGQTADAQHALEESRRICERNNLKAILWPTLFLLSQLVDDAAYAESLRQQAWATVDSIAQTISDPDLRAMFIQTTEQS